MRYARDRTIVTGFLAFEGFPVNPSALLAEGCGRRFELIDVSYDAADEFVAALEPSSFDRLVLTGVAGKSSRLRTERVARNVVGDRPDVRGVVRGPGPIDADGPALLAGTLWTSQAFGWETDVRRPSEDAGDYLCNYVYWRALRRFGAGKRVGFLHVPPVEQMVLERQAEALLEILVELESS
jgi:pyroglutamyl-peptidase